VSQFQGHGTTIAKTLECVDVSDYRTAAMAHMSPMMAVKITKHQKMHKINISDLNSHSLK